MATNLDFTVNEINDALKQIKDNTTNFDVKTGTLFVNKSNTRVGIGTSSPSRRLEINQASQIVSSKFTGRNSSGHLIDINHNPTSAVNTYNGFRFLDDDDNSKSMTLIHRGTDSGRGAIHIGLSESTANTIFCVDGTTSRVGIGTVNPNTNLEVNSGANTNLQIRSSVSSGIPMLTLNNTSKQYQFRLEGSSNDRLVIRDNTAGENRFFINQDGQVGIGVAPSVGFHMKVNNARLEHTDGTSNSALQFHRGGTQIGTISCENYQFSIRARNSKKIRFENQSTSGSVTNSMIIDETGKVGINTLVPSELLEVKGTTANTRAMVKTTTGNAILRVQSTNSDFSLLARGDTAKFDVYDAITNKTPFRIFSTGDSQNNTLVIKDNKIGVGSESPDAKVHIEQGNLRINNATDAFNIIEFAEAGNVRAKIGYNCLNNSLNIRTDNQSGSDSARINIFSEVDNSVLQIINNNGQSTLSIKNNANNGSAFNLVSKVNSTTAGLLFSETDNGDLMTLTKNGHLGINCLPNDLLEIRGDSDPTLVIGTKNNGNLSDSGKISFKEGNDTKRIDLRYDGSENKFIIDTETVDNAFVIQKINGHVGINTSSPSTTLSVNGTTSFQTQLTTISNDSITISKTLHTVQPESGTEDDLSTLSNGSTVGQILIIKGTGSNNITIKHNTGNIVVQGGSDYSLSGSTKYFCCLWDSTNWVELFKS